jgi:hypothetical protein
MIEWLFAYHRRPVSDIAVTRYVEELGTLPAADLAVAVRQWTKTHAPTAFPPSVGELLALVDQGRQQRWQATKGRTPVLTEAFWQRERGVPGYRADVAALMRKRQQGGLTHAAFVEAVTRLAVRWRVQDASPVAREPVADHGVDKG